MARYQSYYAQSKNAKTAGEYTQSNGRAERVMHQGRDSEMRDVCLGCVLDECTGGRKCCPYKLKKKEKRRRAKDAEER